MHPADIQILKMDVAYWSVSKWHYNTLCALHWQWTGGEWVCLMDAKVNSPSGYLVVRWLRVLGVVDGRTFLAANVLEIIFITVNPEWISPNSQFNLI